MVNIRLPDSLGCTVASTSVLFGIIKSQAFDEINVFAKHAELVSHIPGISLPHYATSTMFDLDLRLYTSRRPHNSRPFRASYLHMLEMAEESLGVTLPKEPPKITLKFEDHLFAINLLSNYVKPVLWIQSQTTSRNREWESSRWHLLIKKLSDIFSIIDLSHSGFSLLQSLAITKHCFGGVCLDSFLVHGSAAVGAKNVVVLAGSSRGECITYPGQVLIYEKSGCIAQPCGMHGYYPGCQAEQEYLFNNGNCIHGTAIACMNKITVSSVETVIRQFINQHTDSMG